MYIAALIRCQEIHRIGDILNGAISIERRQFVTGALESFRLPKAFGHVGPHHARRDEVRADALRTVISGNRLRQADERGLHRAVAATTHAGKEDRKRPRLNSSHSCAYRMPSSACNNNLKLHSTIYLHLSIFLSSSFY